MRALFTKVPEAVVSSPRVPVPGTPAVPTTVFTTPESVIGADDENSQKICSLKGVVGSTFSLSEWYVPALIVTEMFWTSVRRAPPGHSRRPSSSVVASGKPTAPVLLSFPVAPSTTHTAW
jgi:hypothetical protein